MINRQLYTMKFKSSRLKKYNYDIHIDYNQALENDEIIQLSDSQLLRTIRDVVYNKADDKEKIKERLMDRDLVEEFYQEIEIIRKRKNSEENIKKIKDLKKKIIKMSYVPEYITIVIEDNTHYDYLFDNGLKVNNIPYYRLSTSAGQGRVSTVTFCSSEVLESVDSILDNGRNKNKPFSPSKFNAYKGTYASATKVVTTPRFCVVPDYESEDTYMVNWVTETEDDEDDDIELKEITKKFNRWDGMGLISPEMAKKWSEDLELDYIPAEFCIRQSFLKGMLCVFPFHEFCEKKNNNNYKIKSIYKDKEGNNIWVDLRDIDVIITESQFKLWDSYNSLENYIENCERNNLKWGASLYTDKELKNSLKMNYQFLQALNIQKEDISELCDDFISWIKGVNSEDIWYSLLFLLGINNTESSIKNLLKDGKNHWIKSLIVNHDLINDKYIKQKIYNLIKTRIENGCMGSIILEGNNQTLVSDPYGFMEYLCEHEEIKGLLGKNRYYSNFWNERNVDEIVGMRPPLTYRSECLKMKLDNTEEQKYWYRYLYGGIIVNVHGHETDNWAGSDWDFDFLSTTSNKIVRKSVFQNEYPVVYQPPKPEKIVFTERDLYISDKFTFGSKIGAITNKSTTGSCLLEGLKQKYGAVSKEYKVTLNRIKMCTKLQSAQIDKAKIGREVKGIPKTWYDRKYIEEMNLKKEEKEFFKRILLDRHPYFFIYLYADTRRNYKKYLEQYDISCKHKFGLSTNELINKCDKTQDEKSYLESFYEYMPVIFNDSVMNNICRYIENVNFDIKNKIKDTDSKDIYLILMRNEGVLDKEIYDKVHAQYKILNNEIKKLNNVKNTKSINKYDETKAQSINKIHEKFMDTMDNICSDTYELTDYLIKIFYEEYPNSNKDLLWNVYGEYIFKNIIDKNQKTVLFPFPDENGNIEYLHQKFSLKEVEI